MNRALPEGELDPRAITEVCKVVGASASRPAGTVSLDDSLDDLGLDVWDLFEVITEIEFVLQVDLDEALPDTAKTVYDLALAATGKLADAGR